MISDLSQDQQSLYYLLGTVISRKNVASHTIMKETSLGMTYTQPLIKVQTWFVDFTVNETSTEWKNTSEVSSYDIGASVCGGV